MTIDRQPRGFTAVDLAVAAGVLGLVLLYFLMGSTRARESSRRLTCQRNLMQIGTALGLYDQSSGRLPTLVLGSDGPVAAMLDELGQPDFLVLRDRTKAPPRTPGYQLVEKPIRGLVCPTDSNARAGRFRAPISYRANTGDSPEARNGPFAIGRRTTVEAVEAAKGAAFTAAFAERLVGDGQAGVEQKSAYALLDKPGADWGTRPVDPSVWRGDAGESWRYAEWRSTLYSHALPPDSPRSWIATDGASALMGASSDHPSGLHVLMLDGSLKTYRPSVEIGVWKALGNAQESPR